MHASEQATYATKKVSAVNYKIYSQHIHMCSILHGRTYISTGINRL